MTLITIWTATSILTACVACRFFRGAAFAEREQQARNQQSERSRSFVEAGGIRVFHGGSE